MGTPLEFAQQNCVQLPPGATLDLIQHDCVRIKTGERNDLAAQQFQDDLITIVKSVEFPLLLGKLRENPDVFRESLSYVLSNADPEWRVVYSGAIVAIAESPLRLVAFAIDEVLNLAFALWSCREHPDIDRLFGKLRSDHLRGSLL